MSSYPIEWHEECYRNNLLYLAGEQERLTRLTEHIAQQTAQVEKYARQIARAKRLGKKAFDSDKFRDQ